MGESQKGPWAFGDGPGRGPGRAAQPGRDSSDLSSACPRVPSPGRSPASARTSVASSEPQTPNFGPRPLPVFNYVIDFRFGRLETPLPPPGFNLPVPFLSLRALPPRVILRLPRAAASPFTPTKWSPGPGRAARPRGSEAAGLPAALRALRSFILCGGAAEHHRRRGRAARGLLLAPRRGCRGSARDPRRRSARSGLGGEPSLVPGPETRPCARGPEAPREANRPQPCTTARPGGTPGLGLGAPHLPSAVQAEVAPEPRTQAMAAASAPPSRSSRSPCIRGAEGEAEAGERGEILISE